MVQVREDAAAQGVIAESRCGRRFLVRIISVLSLIHPKIPGHKLKSGGLRRPNKSKNAREANWEFCALGPAPSSPGSLLREKRGLLNAWPGALSLLQLSGWAGLGLFAVFLSNAPISVIRPGLLGRANI